jgi:hypothetical protein
VIGAVDRTQVTRPLAFRNSELGMQTGAEFVRKSSKWQKLKSSKVERLKGSRAKRFKSSVT